MADRFPQSNVQWLVALVAVLATLAGCSSVDRPTDDRPTDTRTVAKRWMPKPGTTWQWQLTGKIDTSVNAEVFELDSEVPQTALDALHAKGRRTICYVSAGSWENYRSDAKAFPDRILGDQLDDYADERWLDIRQVGTLKPLMARRFDVCAERGFDAIEADNVNGYTNSTGFALTAADQLKYNRMLAWLAHQRGLSIGLKNDIEQIPDLVGDFDFAVNEECMTYDECDAYKPFIAANKAVFHAEYDPKAWNPKKSNQLGLNSVLKDRDLTAWRKQ